MATISLCMIAKDEEKTLRNCLESVKNVVDEIIIVDTGSSDETKSIAQEFTDQVHDFPWIDDFSSARNFSFSHATKDYILWLDADDVFSKKDQEKLKKLKKSLHPTVDGVTMIYHYASDEFGNPTLSFRRERLVKREKGFKWKDPVHEYISITGNIIDSDIVVTHKRIKNSAGRNIAIYEKRLAKGDPFSARDLYYYANELFDHQRHKEAIHYYEKFLSEKDGWVEDKISACGRLADCYQHLGNREKEKQAIYKSFDYAPPRAEFCCMLGQLFLDNKDLETSIFWYRLATTVEKPSNGFSSDAHWTWLPHLQLCLCYSLLGKYDKALEHNETARTYRPFDPNILHNKKLFDQMFK